LVISFKRSQLPFVPRFSTVNLEIPKESGDFSQALFTTFELLVMKSMPE